jgi:hypothetical protein
MAALVILTGVAPVTAPAATALTATGYCGIDWGSGAKLGPPETGGQLVGLRAGRHDCYDRLVFDLRAGGSGHWVSYVDEVTEDPTGHPVPLRGGAKLLITVYSPAYDESGAPTYSYVNPAELVDVTGFRTFRQVAWAGSWEGTTSVGLGVRAQLPFRVLTLPDRLVIDVAHFW